MFGGTVTIDDASSGGSDAGAWLTHIAHTPALRAQCHDFPGARPSGRTDDARPSGGRPGPTGAGGTTESSYRASASVPPALPDAGL